MFKAIKKFFKSRGFFKSRRSRGKRSFEQYEDKQCIIEDVEEIDGFQVNEAAVVKVEERSGQSIEFVNALAELADQLYNASHSATLHCSQMRTPGEAKTNNMQSTMKDFGGLVSTRYTYGEYADDDSVSAQCRGGRMNRRAAIQSAMAWAGKHVSEFGILHVDGEEDVGEC